MLSDFPTGGVLLNLGSDIVEVERIRGVAERQGERFFKRVYTQGELDYCLGMKDPYPHLAARFAAKEAVSKAFTTGIGKMLGWKSVAVYHGERGQPLVRLDEQGEVLLYRVGGNQVLLTLSHTHTYAEAVAAIVK